MTSATKKIFPVRLGACPKNHVAKLHAEGIGAYVRSGLNSHYFHIIGDKLINPIVGVYIPIIRIPVIKGGIFPIPKDQRVDRPWLEEVAILPESITTLYTTPYNRSTTTRLKGGCCFFPR